MQQLTVTDEVHEQISLLARAWAISASDVIGRLLRDFRDPQAETGPAKCGSSGNCSPPRRAPESERLVVLGGIQDREARSGDPVHTDTRIPTLGGHTLETKRRPLAGPSGRPVDRRGCQQYNQSPSTYVPRSTVATVIAYVDGFNLYHGLHDKYHRRYLWLDLEHLVQRLRPNDHIVAVRSFTALVRDESAALARLAAFPPRRSSFEIRSLIRGAFTIAAVDLRNSLLPDTVSDPATGRVHKRPGKWR